MPEPHTAMHTAHREQIRHTRPRGVSRPPSHSHASLSLGYMLSAVRLRERTSCVPDTQKSPKKLGGGGGGGAGKSLSSKVSSTRPPRAMAESATKAE